jgi:hypothetical protein
MQNEKAEGGSIGWRKRVKQGKEAAHIGTTYLKGVAPRPSAVDTVRHRSTKGAHDEDFRRQNTANQHFRSRLMPPRVLIIYRGAHL